MDYGHAIRKGIGRWFRLGGAEALRREGIRRAALNERAERKRRDDLVRERRRAVVQGLRQAVRGDQQSSRVLHRRMDAVRKGVKRRRREQQPEYTYTKMSSGERWLPPSPPGLHCPRRGRVGTGREGSGGGPGGDGTEAGAGEGKVLGGRLAQVHGRHER